MISRERWASNNEPERPASYIRPAITIVAGVLLLLVYSIVVGIIFLVIGTLELVLLLARLWLRRKR